MGAVSLSHFEPLVMEIPAVIKAAEIGGKRIIEVQASSMDVDSEGDVIDQKALLDSAAEFVKTGHLDIDHISELGARYGIPNPESFIIGRPTEVKDLGKGRTSVVGEIRRSKDGTHNPMVNKYDAFWDSLQTNPPTVWRASVYGFPKQGEVMDCSQTKCDVPAQRYYIKGMSWRSLALTRNPVNESLTGYAKIVTAKSWMGKIIKDGQYPQIAPFNGDGAGPCVGSPCDAPLAESEGAGPGATSALMFTENGPSMNPPTPPISLAMPRNLADAVGQWHTHMKSDCPHTEGFKTTIGIKNHFINCCGMDADTADLFSHALMHSLLLQGRRR